MGLVPGFLTNQKREPGGGGVPGPPFALNSADNGLSVDPVSRRIVLGQPFGTGPAGPAALLDAREIPVDGGFSLTFRDYSAQQRTAIAGFGLSAFDNVAGRLGNYTAGTMSINDGGPNLITAVPTSLRLNTTTGGGFDSELTSDHLQFSVPAGTAFTSLNNFSLSIALATGPQALLTPNALQLGDGTQGAKLSTVAGAFTVEGDGPPVTGVVLRANGFTFDAGIGDLDNNGNGTKLLVDDSNSQTIFGYAGSLVVAANAVATDFASLAGGTMVLGSAVAGTQYAFNGAPTECAILQTGGANNPFRFGYPLGVGTFASLLSFDGVHQNYAAAAAATLTNAPVAGNPALWLAIKVGGVVRRFPVW